MNRRTFLAGVLAPSTLQRPPSMLTPAAQWRFDRPTILRYIEDMEGAFTYSRRPEWWGSGVAVATWGRFMRQVVGVLPA